MVLKRLLSSKIELIANIRKDLGFFLAEYLRKKFLNMEECVDRESGRNKGGYISITHVSVG